MALPGLPTDPPTPEDTLPTIPLNQPIPFGFPLPYPAPELRDAPIQLTMGGTAYGGVLRTNWQDRYTRLNNLGISAMRLLLKFAGGLNFNLNVTIQLPNPFDVSPARPPTHIDKDGFPALTDYMKVISDKIDNLHNDLPLIVPVASVVEHWQIRPEALRPQCIFLWGEWKEGDAYIGPPKWQNAVPYFDFALAKTFDNTFGFHKGSRQGILTLADNSKIIMYGRDDTEIDRIITRLKAGIRSDKLTGSFLKHGDIQGLPFSTVQVRLRRIDYYADGQKRGPLTDYLWFPREV